MYVQVEIWADLYYLLPDETMKFVVPDCDATFEEEISTDGGTIYLHIDGSDEYYVNESGTLINHMDYGSNVEGWSGPIHKLSSLKGKIRHKYAKT